MSNDDKCGQGRNELQDVQTRPRKKSPLMVRLLLTREAEDPSLLAMTARRLIYASGGTTTSPFTPPSESGSVAPGDVSQPRATSSGLAVVILCGVTLAFYHGLWLPGLVLIKRDAFRFFLPLKEYLIQRLDAGELPHWFPYEGLGRSFIGVAHTGVFHPFTALYFFTPVPDAYRVSTLLTCVLAGLGTFMLGRMLRVSRTGALFSGLAFTLSGYVVSLTDNLLYLYSICVLPLFCAGLEKEIGRAHV